MIDSSWLWAAGILVGYALVLWANPARAAFRDGLRCARRYPGMFWTLAVLGFWYAVGQELTRYRAGHELENELGYSWWNGWNPPEARDFAASALLPAIEATSGLFNCLISTFPVSILAAVLLWFNWRDTRTTLGAALRKHYPRAGVWFFAGLLFSSICCVAKPALFLMYDSLIARFPSWWTALGIEVVYRLSFLFEYTFAVFIQVTLITVSYVWIRGITYEAESIRTFALHRLGAVMRWALLLYAISFLAMDLPVMLEYFFADFDSVGVGGRWLMAALPLIFPLVQIRLVFHNENVRQSVQDQRQFWKRHRDRFFWFIAVAFLVFYPLAVLDDFLQTALGSMTAAGIAWNLLFPMIWAPFAAWMLASWVCLFKQTENRKPAVDDWIAF